MATQLLTVLEITVVGMGLVFGAIILLWLGMSLLVSLTADRKSPQGFASTIATSEDDLGLLRKQAAAAAVAFALEEQKIVRRQRVPPPTATISPWQSVMRGRQLKERGPIR